MKLFGPVFANLNDHAMLSMRIVSEHLGEKELWFSIPKEYESYFCKDQADGFVVGLLFAAMQYGEDIHVGGCMSERLLFALNNYVVPLVKAFSPTCVSVKITADRTRNAGAGGQGVGSGFSGGVDSFCTIYDRFQCETSAAHRLNTLLFFNVGSHGPWVEGDTAGATKRNFEERYRHLKQFPDEIGLNYVPIDSNLHAFHPWGHQKTHTLTSAAAILVMQQYFSKYYYSSTGIDYAGFFSSADKYRERDIGIYCEPILLPLLSTESINLIPDGYQYTRVQKIQRIADYEPAHKYLNVCTSPIDGWRNCSVCPKCCRTQMTLSAIGKLDAFAQVFDSAKYRRVAERRYVRRQVSRVGYDIYARQNVQLGRERSVPMPSYLSSRLVCALEDSAAQISKSVLPDFVLEFLRSRRRRSN